MCAVRSGQVALSQSLIEEAAPQVAVAPDLGAERVDGDGRQDIREREESLSARLPPSHSEPPAR